MANRTNAISSATNPARGLFFSTLTAGPPFGVRVLVMTRVFVFGPARIQPRAVAPLSERVRHSAHEIVKLRFEVQFGAKGRASLDNGRAAGREFGSEFPPSSWLEIFQRFEIPLQFPRGGLEDGGAEGVPSQNRADRDRNEMQHGETERNPNPGNLKRERQ